MANLNIAIAISAKDQGASGVLGGITKTLGGLGNVAGGLLVGGLGLATVGIGALGAGLALAVNEAMGAQEVMAQTQAVIKSTGGAAGMTAEQIGELATSLSLSSRFSDDAIQKGENLLLTFTNIGGDVFPMATQAMVDMAAAMGTDISGGAIQLGKALKAPIAGISALSRVGVIFTAAAAAATFGGQMDVLKNRLLNVAEAIGGPLLDVGGRLIDKFLLPALPVIEQVGTTIATMAASAVDAFSVFGDDIPGAIANVLYYLDQFIPGAADVGDAFLNIVGVVQDNLPQVKAIVADVFGWITAHSEEIKGALIAVGVVLAGAGIISGILAVGAAVAALVTPVGLVIAAAALLGAAGAGHGGDIHGKTAAVWAWLQPLLAELWIWLQVNIPVALQLLANFWTGALLPAINTVWAWIQGTLFPLLAQLGVWLQTNIPIALQALANFWTTVLQPAIAGVINWVVTNMPAILATVQRIFAGVQSVVAVVLPAVQGIIKGILTGIQTFWNAWGVTILAMLSNIFENFGLVFDAFGAAFRGDWTRFGEDLRKIWDNAWENIKLLLSNALQVFLSIDWGGIGSAIMQGIANGIQAYSYLLTEAAKSAAQAAFEAAKGFLGINSPSTLFATIGANMMFGMAQGISDNTELPSRASERAAASSAGAASAAPAGAGQTVNHNYYVTAQYPYQDERSLVEDLSLFTRLRGST